MGFIMLLSLSKDTKVGNFTETASPAIYKSMINVIGTNHTIIG